MFQNSIHGSMAIARRIFKKFAQLAIAQAFPDHWFAGRWQMPIRRSRRHVLSRKIMVLMAGAASQTGDTLTVQTTANVHGMPMQVISLPGKVSTGMAIHTARMPEHWNY